MRADLRTALAQNAARYDGIKDPLVYDEFPAVDAAMWTDDRFDDEAEYQTFDHFLSNIVGSVRVGQRVRKRRSRATRMESRANKLAIQLPRLTDAYLDFLRTHKSSKISPITGLHSDIDAPPQEAADFQDHLVLAEVCGLSCTYLYQLVRPRNLTNITYIQGFATAAESADCQIKYTPEKPLSRTA